MGRMFLPRFLPAPVDSVASSVEPPIISSSIPSVALSFIPVSAVEGTVVGMEVGSVVGMVVGAVVALVGTVCSSPLVGSTVGASLPALVQPQPVRQAQPRSMTRAKTVNFLIV